MSKLKEDLDSYFSQYNSRVNPTTLRWENLVNRPELQRIFQQSDLPKNALKNTYLLSPEYFNTVVQEREYPFTMSSQDLQSISGFAPSGGSFRGGVGLNRQFNNSIVLKLQEDLADILPNIFRHEYSHKYLPSISGERNYGYMLPEDIQRFLSWYSPKERGEELQAEMFAGRQMPEELRKILWEKLRTIF